MTKYVAFLRAINLGSHNKVSMADLRGLSPQERAKTIISKCVHPDYKPLMQEYYERAKRECCELNVGHEPHLLFKVFKMQQHLAEKGTMKIDNWN